jgi:hypothetical protein
MTATTMLPMAYSSADRARLPYLTDRELDGIVDAICDGELVAVADISGQGQRTGQIVAVAVPELADELTNRDPFGVKTMREHLRKTLHELESLRTIIGEVMAEKCPRDFRYRLDDAEADVQRALDSAIDASEDL